MYRKGKKKVWPQYTMLHDRRDIIRALGSSVTPATCIGFIAELIHKRYSNIGRRECVAQAILEYNATMGVDAIILGDELKFIEDQISIA